MYKNVGFNIVKFEWEVAKAHSNRVKHHVSFELARDVWTDPLHVIVPDRFEDGEQRWHAVGMVGSVTVLVVVHSYPEDNVIRIIGARKATSHERRRYEQQQI
jgi:uncharacterized DUF497 family protein